ncbi:TolC family outer membrane protein [Photobacterium damselae]|uniref:Agglutination protein n=1 Tax=Photobacterium damselae TaxID=38293 RepID=A0ABD6X1N6_PHODM|nr:TolC family outer membrane protein [Photobacterium damselae]OBU46699.1 hypothetical protein AYY27_03725 [Photobacterium damselae]PSU16318.1 agglutination protein [Photobacterium damselae]
MKLSTISLSISALLFSINSYSQTLEESLAQTLNNNPEIKAAFSDFKIKDEEIGIRTGHYLPSINVNGKMGYTDDNENNYDYNPAEVSVTLDQLIWDGNITYNDIQRSKQEAEAERFNLASRVNDISLKVSQAYLNVIYANESLQLAQQNLKSIKEIYNNIHKRVTAGISSNTDETQADSRLARAQANVLAAQADLQDKSSQFYTLVGQMPSDLVTPEVDQSLLPSSLDKMIKQAKENNPTIMMAQHDIEASKYKHKITKGNFLPELSVHAGQTWGTDVSAPGNDVDEASVMLQLKYNIYNGGSDAAKARQAAYDMMKSKDIYANAIRQLETGSKLSWTAYNLNANQKGLLEDHVIAAEKTLSAYKKQWQIGQRTLLDVLNTENEVYQAKLEYSQAKHREIEAKYRILNATGELLKATRVNVDPAWNKSVL